MARKRKHRQTAPRRRPAKTAVAAAATTTATATAAATPGSWRQRLCESCESLFATAHPRPTERWAYLRPLLLAAFLVRAVIALWGDFVLHPDEIMQYLEPAHYAAFGNGVLYWEYVHGARNWLIPGVVTGVLKTLDALGLGQPVVYIPVVKLLFCLLSLLVPWAMYRFTQATVNEQAARLALIFGCFWYELAAMAHKPFSEFVSTTLFMVVLALSVGSEAQRRGNLFAVGLLAALSGALRMQYAPLALLLLLLRSAYLRGGGLAALWGGALLLTALVGILEWQTWGAPFHSYVTNFFMNLALDAGRTGESSRWMLLGQLAAASGGCVVLAFVAGARNWRRDGGCRLILLLSAVTLILHLLPEHREYRFIHLLIPCWLMLLAAWLPRCGGGRKASALVRRYGAVAVLAFGIPALLNVFPWQVWIYKSFSQEHPLSFLRDREPIYEMLSFLAKEDDVRGVFYRTQKDNSYFRGGGYYYLHHDVPFYTRYILEEAKRQRPGASWESLFSHVITEAGQSIPGFELLRQRGNLAVWRRLNNDKPVAVWREHVMKGTHPQLNALVAKTLKRLRASPLFGFFVADLYWEKSPPPIEMADD